ncbi:MAG: thiamine-binding protein [Actinomycetota bacterium]
MEAYRAEFMIEPFTEGSPGPPVLAGIDAVREQGFDPEVGAFGTTIVGEPGRVAEALRSMVDAAMDAGATRVTVQIDRPSES